jgi:hypothetical protein
VIAADHRGHGDSTNFGTTVKCPPCRNHVGCARYLETRGSRRIRSRA